MTYPQQAPQGFPQQAPQQQQQQYGAPQGFGQPQQGYPQVPQQQAPNGYPQGYGDPQQAYGAPQAYGQPQGYGQQQYGAPQVPQQQAPQQQPAQGTLAQFFSQPVTGGGKSINLEPGQPPVIGIVARQIGDGDVEQSTKYRTNGELDWHKDGRPKLTMRVPLQIENDSRYPDGQAQLYVSGNKWNELTRAMAEAGVDANTTPPEMGATIGWVCTGYKAPSAGGGSPAKVYQCFYRRPEGAQGTNGTAAQVPQQPAAPVAQQMAQVPQQQGDPFAGQQQGQPQQVGQTDAFNGWQQQAAQQAPVAQQQGQPGGFAQVPQQQGGQGFDPSAFGGQPQQAQVPQQQGQPGGGFDPNAFAAMAQQGAPQQAQVPQQGQPGGFDDDKAALLARLTGQQQAAPQG